MNMLTFINRFCSSVKNYYYYHLVFKKKNDHKCYKFYMGFSFLVIKLFMGIFFIKIIYGILVSQINTEQTYY